MAAEIQTPDATAAPASRKRLRKNNKGKKTNKRAKQNASSMAAALKPRKPSLKMKKLFQKRAREYHSDDEEEDDEGVQEEQSSDEEVEEEGKKDLDVGDDYCGGSEEDDDDDREGAQLGITRFVEGCRAFNIAFKKIMKRNLPDDSLGPILSAHRKLVAQKLAEEDTENKAKGEMKKQKEMAAEKGHIKPDNFLDAKEKFLISVATKGVVKLFNAVSKAQSSQSGLNPSRSKDAKALAKRRKKAFFSELQKPAAQSNEIGWAPLRDTYMLTSAKLKDWDKNAEPAAEAGQEKILSESSSDEE